MGAILSRFVSGYPVEEITLPVISGVKEIDTNTIELTYDNNNIDSFPTMWKIDKEIKERALKILESRNKSDVVILSRNSKIYAIELSDNSENCYSSKLSPTTLGWRVEDSE